MQPGDRFRHSPRYDGRVTSRELTARYLERIATYEDRLNAIITVNPRALDEAEQRLAEFKEQRLSGLPTQASSEFRVDELRNELVPLNRKYPIAELLQACRDYPGASNARRITF